MSSAPLDSGSVSAASELSGAQIADNEQTVAAKSRPAIKKPSPRAELSLEALLDRALEEAALEGEAAIFDGAAELEQNSPEASSEEPQASQPIQLGNDEQARAVASAAACSQIEETAKLSGIQLKDLLAGLGEDDMPAFKTAQLDAIASAVRPVAPRPRPSCDDLLQPLDTDKRPAPSKIFKVKASEPPQVIQRPVSAEEPKTEEKPIEQPEAAESHTEELKVEQPKVEEPTVEEAPAEDPKAEGSQTEQLKVEVEKDTFPQTHQPEAPKTWTNNDFPNHAAVTQLAEAGKFVMNDDRVSRTDLVHLLEGFVKILRTDSKSNLPAEVNYDLTATGGRYTDAIVDDRTQEIENMRKVIVEAQETIIKLLTDRVEDRAKIASLETQIKLLPDLQAQADRAMAVAIHTEDFRADLTKVKFELERYRLARVRAEAENRKSWFRRVWVWVHGKWTRSLAEKN